MWDYLGEGGAFAEESGGASAMGGVQCVHSSSRGRVSGRRTLMGGGYL